MTVHGVLAGCYRGRSEERATLYHGSNDGGNTALCSKVREGALADEYGTPPEVAAPTCKACLRKWSRK
jgi:hypothetical protein